MLFVSGKSPHLSITHRVYDFFTERYEIASDVEVFHTNLKGENAHHQAETIFKAFALALKQACSIDEQKLDQIPSTKGSL